MKIKTKYLGFLFGFCLIMAYGQQQEIHRAAIPDSLLQKTYDELEKHFNEVRNDFPRAALYAKAYLKKSSSGKDISKQANAYYFLSLIHDPLIAEKYADTIISITREISDDTYPARGLLIKALALQRQGKYKDALDQWLEADSYATANNNASQLLYIKFHIGILKNNLEEYNDLEDKEALEIFKAYLQQTEKNYKKDKSYEYEYSRALFALGDCYNRNGKYDSAVVINKKGIAFALKNKSTIDPVYFTMSFGITAYHKKKYSASLDSLHKVATNLRTRDDTGNLIVCYLFIGKVYKDQGKINDAIVYFKKVDAIAEKTSDAFPVIKEAYETLTDYYEERKDRKNQLKYIQRLLEIDSTLIGNYKYLSKKIDKKYNIPKEIIEARYNKLRIQKLYLRLNTLTISIILVSLIALLISVFAYYYYSKQRKYQARFEALLNEKNTAKKRPLAKARADTIADLNISEKAVNNITAKLKLFVEEKQYLNNDVSVSNWAKAMETNPKYLSKIINFYEQKTFSIYITELRINYAVKELEVNPTLRKYSIRSIAEEMGFNNAQSFSKAFYKKTGLYPSYFIRALEKELLRREMQGATK